MSVFRVRFAVPFVYSRGDHALLKVLHVTLVFSVGLGWMLLEEVTAGFIPYSRPCIPGKAITSADKIMSMTKRTVSASVMRKCTFFNFSLFPGFPGNGVHGSWARTSSAQEPIETDIPEGVIINSLSLSITVPRDRCSRLTFR